ncbi:MAG: SUMF1/EgtB/PvdO family nonheme iron enzyme [Polyangiales bacterium]
MPVTTDADAGQSDVSDATDVSDAIEMFDATDVSDAADVRDVTDASNVSDATDVTDATNLSDVRDVVDVFGAIDVLDVSDVTDAVIADSPTMPNVIADASCAAGLVNCGGACANLCAMPTPAPAQRSCAVAGTPGCGMASVAAGTFNMGGDPSAPNSTPVQSNVSVGAFYVDRYEVTVARFRQFASAIPGIGALSGIAQYTRDGAPFGLDYAVAPPYEPTFHSANAACNWSPTAETLEAHPINCVSWSLAMAFCAWDGNTSGGRLPTEAEWEWVARGAAVGSLSSGRTYPWGEAAPTCALANTLGCATSTLPVNASPRGTYGLFDLIGNVYEWTADQYSRFGVGSYWTGGPRTNPLNTVSDTTTGRVTRGGGWEQAPLRSAGRNVTRENGSTTGTTGYPSVGFRCARSAP